MIKLTNSKLALVCLALLISSFSCQTDNITIAAPAANTAATPTNITVTPPASTTAPPPANTPAPPAAAVVAPPASTTAPPPANTPAPPAAAVATPPASTTAPPAAAVVAPPAANTIAPPPANTTAPAAAAVVAPPAANTTAPSPANATVPPPPLPYPPTNLNLYLTEPFFYSNDVNNQVISYLFCGNNVPTNVTACVIYDGRDPSVARLLGIEYLVNETVFNSFTPTEQRFWHSHAYAVQSGNVIAPELSGVNYTNTLNFVAASYGKAVFLWSETQPLPIGDPILAFAFSANGQFNSTASGIYDNQTATNPAQRAANNANMTIPTPAIGADSWDFTGTIPVFTDVNVTLPPNLWGLAFPQNP